MSSAIQAYAADLGHIGGMLGNADTRVWAALRGRFAQELLTLDEQLGGPDPGDLSSEEVLARLILEPATRWNFGDAERIRALYAFELLCRAGGEWLPNEHWSALHLDWFGSVDEALAELKLPFATEELMLGGAPLGLPDADDFPAVGSLTREECRRTLALLRAAPLEQLADQEVRESLEQLAGWLHTCAERNVDLVCFLY